jgi:2-aminoadipate transaminase
MSKSVLAPPLPSSGAAGRVGSSAIRDLLHLTERPEVISLAGGLPSPEAFPVAELAAATAEILDRDPTAALQYTTTEGLPALRAWVDDDPDRVVVTHGSQQALDLLVRATVRPGDTVALADPGYVGALQVFRLAGAELAGIPADGDGLRVDVLAERLADGLRPALVYVVPEFDNPSGVTLSEERRHALADLAERYGFLIVADDPYGALRWRGEAPTPLADLSDQVVTLGTTSKILTPGLRVGWAVAPTALARELVVLKQAADLHTSSLSQQLAAALLTRPGFLPPHLDGLRARYRAQCDALVAALQPLPLRFHTPNGGMFLWAEADQSTKPLLARALDRGVAFVPGDAFSVETPHERGLRLSFATASPQQLQEAAERLSRAL